MKKVIHFWIDMFVKIGEHMFFLRLAKSIVDPEFLILVELGKSTDLIAKSTLVDIPVSFDIL